MSSLENTRSLSELIKQSSGEFFYLDSFQDGELLAVSPGGVREALFSDENYKLVWSGRLGFAKVAQEAQVVRI